MLLGCILAAAVMLAPSDPAAFATCGGGGGGGVGGLGSAHVYKVPWQKLYSETLPASTSFSVVWFPASENDLMQSPLNYSRMLAAYGTRCVGMYAALPNNPLRKKLEVAETPAVVLTEPDGKVIARAALQQGPQSTSTVEQLVDFEMQQRGDNITRLLDSARNKASGGDTQGAIESCREILKQRCLFPRQARSAASLMRKLGTNPDLSSIPDKPDASPAVNAKIEKTMQDGLDAELKDNYIAAEKYYLAAHHIDPADPTPLRYLGELYRHDLGEWDKARQTFNTILSMDADPLSRAVALHGLGKMTIHDGQFKKGLSLMEESVQVYPLALAYRNLAVYWNSEGDSAKCAHYIHEAAILAPDDPFNIVFAAVFMAANGHKEEALAIAKAHEDLMPASYNLAAIYAQNGDKDKALELLKRHFFQYERYKSVRSKEMMEARVDAVFASLKQDKRFIALTAGADNKLRMNGMPSSANAQ